MLRKLYEEVLQIVQRAVLMCNQCVTCKESFGGYWVLSGTNRGRDFFAPVYLLAWAYED